jgi:hypothetical protein
MNSAALNSPIAPSISQRAQPELSLARSFFPRFAHWSFLRAFEYNAADKA